MTKEDKMAIDEVAELLAKNGWTVKRVDPWSIRLKQENGDSWIVHKSMSLFEAHVHEFLSVFVDQ